MIPWDTIQPAAEKVGKSLATLINGAVETSGLADSVGKTAGELLNIGISGADAFITNLHFDSLGGFIADAMNAAVNTIAWSDIGGLIADSLNGIFLLAETWTEKFNFKKLGSELARACNAAIEKISWKSAGSSIRKGLNGIFKLAETWSGKFNFKQLGKAVKTLINSTLTGINWKSAITATKKIGEGIADALNGFINTETFSNIGKTFASVVNTVVSGAHSLIGTVDWVEWGKAIGTSINDFFGTADWEELGLTFGDAVLGLIASLKEAVTTTDWSEIAYDIADMLKSMPWEEILKDAADLIGSVFVGLLDFGTALLQGFDSNEWTEFNRNIEKALGSLEKTNDEIETRIQNASDWKDAGAEYSYAKDLADKYFDLAEKEGKTNEETETMKDLAGQLVETIPQLEEYYNSETGLLDTTRTSVDNLIESLKAKARTEAAQDALKEFYSAQLEAKKAMDEAKSSADELTGHYDEQKKKYDELNQKIDEATQKYGAESGEVQGLVGQQASYYEEMLRTEQKLGNVNEELQTAQTNYQNASSEIDTITGYYADMNQEAGNAATSTEKVGTNTGNTTGEFLKSIVQLAAMALGLGGIKDGSDDADGSISTLGTTISEFVTDLAENAKTALEKGKETGKNYPSGMAEGIEENSYLVSDAGEGVVKSLNKAVENKADIHSPSGVAKGYGEDYDQGLVNGLESYAYKVDDKVSEIVKNIKDSFDIGQTMYNKGQSIIQSFVNGMKSISIPTPHITFTTSTQKEENSVKTTSSSSISWYAKGGLFNGPAQIGIGEGGKEAALPLERPSVMRTLANSILSGISPQMIQRVPFLAAGTVIPPRAVKSGETVELQHTVASLNNLLGNLNIPKNETGARNMTIRIPVILNGRQVFEAVIDEAKMKQLVSGRNPFEMA